MDELSTFSCSASDLSRTNITEEAWSVSSNSSLRTISITVLAVCQVFVITLGIPWNTIVLVTIAVKRYKESIYLLLANLVVADLILGFSVIFYIVSGIKQEFTLGNSDYERCQLCHAITISGTALSHVSSFILTLLSVDRLVYVQWPFQYSKYANIKLTISFLFVVWAISILISIPPVFGFGEIKFDEKFGFCTIQILGTTDITANSNYVIFLVSVNILPCLITVAANIWLLLISCNNVSKRRKRLVRSVRNTFHSFRTKATREKIVISNIHKEQVHLAHIFGSILFVNVVTWLPIFSLIIVQLVSRDAGGIPIPIFTLSFLSFTSQPTLHPILETCLMGKVRTTILSSIKNYFKKVKRNNVDIKLSSNT